MARTGDIDNWEYKLVKFRGFVDHERVFVRKEKDGNVGFMVFAPFITSQVLPALAQYDKPNSRTTYNGFWVNLGWVPADNTHDYDGSSPLEPIVRSFISLFETLNGYLKPSSFFLIAFK